LRKGVKFHSVEGFTPSRDFNADDVIFSFDRQGNKDNPYYAYAPGVSYEYYAGMDMPTIIKSIEKVDDYTVKFTLSEPNAPFLADLAMDFASIMSKEYADKLA
ncbi:ABC transporter substrate-binding protein, partial [Thioclava sp. UBA3469]